MIAWGNSHYLRRRLGACLLAVVGLSGCAAGQPDSTSPSSLAAQVPAELRNSGTLRVATSAPFGPIVFTDAAGRLAGFDVDVITEVAHTLGLRPEYRQMPFQTILPDVAAGSVDVGARGIFDTFARERRVDMVTYFNAGTQWAQRAGSNVDPNNACGLRVAVDDATTQHKVELPTKSRACTTVGDKAITAVPFATQAEATAALERGDVDAMSADSPVTANEIKNSAQRLIVAGDIFDAEPYGLAVKKGSALGPVLAQVITELIRTGRLAKIAAAWGLGAGMIDESKLNGATN
ncbi:transporter substrate-binding domain-containing protein [Gordonia sp. TBRC 11910]|uniref:Transporter substrate-binding domain-containing protein n=1 Tax=Gordonia asplenii TaxID=2725283 RepID=A0A848KVY9_9ACTN|nr:transporter substrate-binding domain-containing protein [Gordonia asplenii]NMO02227.1 transporter substrate-binding domain-containing protein [Gordonia asplenii]